MISIFIEIKFFVRASLRLFFLEMHNKTFIEFGFCDMQNYRGRGKCYQPSRTSQVPHPIIVKYLIMYRYQIKFLNEDNFNILMCNTVNHDINNYPVSLRI